MAKGFMSLEKDGKITQNLYSNATTRFKKCKQLFVY